MQLKFTMFRVTENDFADWLRDATENQFQPCTLEVQPTSKPGYKQYHWVLSGRVIAWITTKKAQSFIKVTLAQSVLPGTELDGDDVPEIVGAVCRLFKLRGWGYDSPNAVLENMELQIGFWLSEGTPYLEEPLALPQEPIASSDQSDASEPKPRLKAGRPKGATAANLAKHRKFKEYRKQGLSIKEALHNADKLKDGTRRRLEKLAKSRHK